MPVIFAAEFDPKDPAVVLLQVTGYPDAVHKRGTVLCYGAGADPLMNITDDKDMAIPAFGPVAIPAPKERGKAAVPKGQGQAGNAALKVPADVLFQSYVEYRPGGTAHDWCLDYAKPAHAAGPLPAIMMVHGGGWKGNNGKVAYDPICIAWAQRGYFVMAINYRISSSTVHTFPAAIEDCKCAVRGLRAHASTLGVDPNKIGVYGSSAGGHLALMLGILSTQKFGDHYEGDGPWQEQSSDVAAVVSDAGVVNLDQSLPGNNTLKRAFNDFLGGTPPSKETVRDASPASYADRAAKLPPLLMLYGTADSSEPIVLTDSFIEDLRAKGHPDLTYLRYEGIAHSPWWLQWEKYRLPAVKDSLRADREFLRSNAQECQGPFCDSRKVISQSRLHYVPGDVTMVCSRSLLTLLWAATLLSSARARRWRWTMWSAGRRRSLKGAGKRSWLPTPSTWRSGHGWP